MSQASKRIINDFTIEIATVNGSGSQTSNFVLTRAIFSMGIPVGPKNVFPSNIAGLPTWYFIRVNSKGHVARRRDTDILVGFNPMTFAQDVARLKSGGVVIHESSYSLSGSSKREDLIYYPVPFEHLAARHISEFKLKKPLTNMIYVGVLAEILGIEEITIEAAIERSLKGKEKAIRVNLEAIGVGRNYVKENLKKIDPYYLERTDGVRDKILMDGNTASALGCLFGGCAVAAWYPITPASSLSETLLDLFEEFRKDKSGKNKYAVIQAEDELAALGIALGAGWTGCRAVTATSGPGLSLMAEFAGFGYYAEVPVVIFDIQRLGPSTGLPTRTSQGDIGFVSSLSHGDTKHVMLIPGNIKECFEFAHLAFDLADRLQTPVFVMSDLDLGMNFWMTDAFDYPQKPFDRGKVLSEEDLKRLGRFERYRDVDGDGICYRTYPGNAHPLAAYFTRGSGHNEAASYTEDGLSYQRGIDRLLKKFETARTLVPSSIQEITPGAKVGLIAYGSTDQVIPEARQRLAQKGMKTNYLRIRAYPWDQVGINEFFRKCHRVFVIEQNRDAQMTQLLKPELDSGESKKIRSILHYSGFPIPVETVIQGVLHKAGEGAVEELPVEGMEGGE